MSVFETIELNIQGIKVTVRKKGEGAPLIYLHGAFGYYGWPDFLDQLSETYAVYSPIHPGFLEAAGIEQINDLYDLTLFHLDLIEELQLEKPSILGHYFGAMIGAEVAAVCSHNVGKLVMACPAGFWIDEDPGLDYFVVPNSDIRKHLIADHLNPRFANIVPWSDDESEQDQSNLDRVKALSTVAKFLWPVPDKGLSRRIKRIKSDTLVITAKEDPIVPVSHGRKCASLINNSEHHILQHCGHLAMLEDPVRFVDIIKKFIM